MIIDRISTRSFAKHDTVDVELPRAGVVVVTGNNGHGKSTLAEAVAAGCWNETLRGAPGWRQGESSGVEIQFDGGSITRSVTSTKHYLKWIVGDDGAAEFATRTKSQEALESRIGTFHVWKHACTFHTDDLARFTRASDAERKKLLEEVLELDRVESAYRQARDFANVERRKLVELTREVDRASMQLSSLEDQLKLLDGELEDVPDIDAMRQQLTQLKDAVSLAAGEADNYQSLLNELRVQIRDRDVELGKSHRRLNDFQVLGPVCGHCEQIVDPAHAAEHVQALNARIYALQEDQRAVESRVRKVSGELREKTAGLALAQEAHQRCLFEGREAVAAQRRNDERLTKRAMLAAEHERAMTVEEAARAQLEAQESTVKEIDHAAHVLSFQGVRAALLDGAVKALQDLARDWLNRLGLADLSVELDSQSQAKTGRVSDKISFTVTGAGGGYGYKGCSTGERRRIDIAMMLALGELAADSRGVSKHSTMFFDEVFDGLDAEGREAAVAMLNELAQDRCVVVITHNKELTAQLQAKLRLHVENGRIT